MATEAQNNVVALDNSVKELTNSLKPHVDMLGKIVLKYIEWNKNMIQLPSDLINRINDLTAANNDLAKSNEKVIRSTMDAEAKRKAAAEAAKAEAEATKASTTAQIASIDATIKQIRLEIEQARSQKIRTKATEDSIKVRERELAQLEKSNNFYNRVQKRVNELTQTYNDLALKKELGMKLNTDEQAQLLALTKQLNIYQNGLIKVDSVIQKNGRNVGNYSSQWNGLTHNINQVTRELPAFANSAQTGFMALSNNIPMLVDEIVNLSRSVKTLRADGQQVPGVMSQILSSFLSWQTLLSVGITLITLYGKEIGEFFKEMFVGNKIMSTSAKLLETYNKTLKDGDYEKAYSDVAKVAISFEQARKGVLTKKDALKIYNGVLGDVMGRTNDFAKAETTLNNQARNYVEATMAKAQANILLSESAQLAAENVELQNRKEQGYGERLMATLQTGGIFGQIFSSSKDLAGDAVLENRNKIIESNTKQINANKKAAEELVKKFQVLSKDLNMGNLFGDDEKDKKDKKDNTLKDRLQAEYEAAKSKLELEKANAVLQDEIHAKEIQLATLERDHKLKMVDLEVKDKATATKQKIAIENEYATTVKGINNKMADDYGDEFTDEFNKTTEYFNTVTQAVNGTTESIDKLIARGEELGLTDLKIQGVGLKDGSKDYFKNQRQQIEAEYEKNILLYKNDLEKITEYGKERELKLAELKQKELEILIKFNEDLKGILATSFDSLGFGSVSLIFDEQIQEMWRMADETQNVTAKMAIAFQVFGQIANDVFTKLKSSSDQYYENQYSKLEKEKEVALKYAGENTAGREDIEKQYETRRLQLKREQAKQEKEMAIFQALINVATGITAALAQGPAGIALAAIIGILGAAQIASISAQPLPAFATGTQNAPEGWAIIDELRPEVHTDKHGNIKSTGSKGGANVRYLEQGDKIFKSHSDFFREMSGSSVDQYGDLNLEYNGISKEEMMEVMSVTLGNQTKEVTTIDENGFNSYIINGQNRTRRLNRKTRFKK